MEEGKSSTKCVTKMVRTSGDWCFIPWEPDDIQLRAVSSGDQVGKHLAPHSHLCRSKVSCSGLTPPLFRVAHFGVTSRPQGVKEKGKVWDEEKLGQALSLKFTQNGFL